MCGGAHVHSGVHAGDAHACMGGGGMWGHVHVRGQGTCAGAMYKCGGWAHGRGARALHFGC